MPASLAKIWLNLLLALVLAAGSLPALAGPMDIDCWAGKLPAATHAENGVPHGGHAGCDSDDDAKSCCQGHGCLGSHCVSAVSIPAHFELLLAPGGNAPIGRFSESGSVAAQAPPLPPPILQGSV